MSCNNDRCQTCKVVNIGPTTVKQWYESNADTNAFTDRDRTKLHELISKTSLDGKDGIDGLPGINGINGTNGKDGNRGATGNDGAQGYQGIPGKDGKDGANIPVPGPRGATGARGDVGIHGLDGTNGRDGVNGIGFQGAKGDTGDRGLQGIPGAVGHIGLDGPRGFDGKVGTQGTPGPRGGIGANGLDGKDGTVGGIVGTDTEANILLKHGNVGEMWIITDPAKAGQGLLSDGNGSGASHWTNIGQLSGPRGIQGIQGLDGFDGQPGVSGPAGPQSVVPGPPGPIGLTGAQGADSVVSGPQGIQGIKGDEGDKGDTGNAIDNYISESVLPAIGDIRKIYKINRNASGLYDIHFLVWDNVNNAYIPLPADVASSADGSVGYRVSLTDSLTIKESISNLDVVGEMGHRQINIYDRAVWKNIYDEEEIKRWIAAAAKFEGVAAENGHSLGTGVREFNDLAGMMSNLTEAELILKVGHYFTWTGTDGYIVKSTDLGGELVGDAMHTNDWLQLVNSGGKITDPNDPLYANEKPIFHTIHISGDNLSKSRADGLYSFNAWIDGTYEKGSLVTDNGKVYKALQAIVPGDMEPELPNSKWVEVDLSGISAGSTKELEIEITALTGENFELLKFLPKDTSDLTITVEAIEPDGATYDMRYIASEGADPLLTPIGINSHNGTVSSFGVLDKSSIDYIIGTSSSDVATKYRIIVSSRYHDVSHVEVGDGVAISDNFTATVDSSKNYPDNTKSDSTPIGTVIQHVSYTPPVSYLLCDGSTFDITKFPLLNQVLGSDKLPDLRDQFIRGANAQNQINGFTKHQWTTAKPRNAFNTDIRGNHKHDFDSNTSYSDDGDGHITSGGDGGSQNINQTHINYAGSHSHKIISGGDTETVPDHVRLAYHIKAM